MHPVIEFRDVDRGVEPQLHEWYDVWAAAQRHRPEVMVETWEASRRALATPYPSFAWVPTGWSARRTAEIFGTWRHPVQVAFLPSVLVATTS